MEPLEFTIRLCPYCYGEYETCGCGRRIQGVGWVQGRDSLTWVEAKEMVKVAAQRLARQGTETPKAWSARMMATLGLTESVLRESRKG